MGYQVYATQNPQSSRTLIGHIELTGNFAMSNFGDTQLFFQHQPLEEDLKFRPEWAASPDVGCVFPPWLYQPPVNLGCTLCQLDGCGTNDTMLATDEIFA